MLDSQVDLGWRKTWEDSEEDYVYCDGAGRQLGRAYFDQMKHWRWFFAGSSGLAGSRREALLAVEQAYEAKSARIRGLIGQPAEVDRAARRG